MILQAAAFIGPAKLLNIWFVEQKAEVSSTQAKYVTFRRRMLKETTQNSVLAVNVL